MTEHHTTHPGSVRPHSLRIAMLPWMVAGVRTQYENMRLLPLARDISYDTFPIIPYQAGGLIERLPLLRPSQKGTLRSTAHALPLLTLPAYDAIWTQSLLPLLPFLAACDLGLRRRPIVVYTIDTTPKLMDAFYPIYYGMPPAGARKSSLRDALYRHLLRRCAWVTPWSQWAARSFIRDYHVSPEHIRVIPPGVDLVAWSVPEHRRRPQDGHNLDRPFRLLFVGADFERKGGSLLLDVFRQNLRDTCELHLVTKAAAFDEPGVRVYREFGPNDRGLRELYERCDALVLPTRADCFSLASIEAMATGLPVISCPIGGIPEIVEHEQTGLLVPPDDGRALLATIHALVRDRRRGHAMGVTGRRVVEDRFDNVRNTMSLLELLQSRSSRLH